MGNISCDLYQRCCDYCGIPAVQSVVKEKPILLDKAILIYHYMKCPYFIIFLIFTIMKTKKRNTTFKHYTNRNILVRKKSTIWQY